VPEGSLLLVDEAYCEFAPSDELPTLDVSNPKILRLRTFSKAYGMAGARVGYAIGHPTIIRAFDKIRNHFGMNRSAVLGAIAALKDQEWLNHVINEVNAAKLRIGEIAKANGLTPLPSATNFVTIDCGHGSEFAKAVVDGLVKRGVFVRMPFVEPHNRCIRVSAGKKEHLDLLEQMLPLALKESQNI
jgi:histidinol-phosphate aminotransferase